MSLTGANVDAVTGQAPIKPVQQLRLVGQSPTRDDIPPKVDGTLTWAVDVKRPGMVHARHVRPPFAGATVVSIDEASVRDLPGFVQVVHERNYVAVVCEREEQAIRAARQLKVEWKKPATAPLPHADDLFDYMRRTAPSATMAPVVTGDPAAALAGAARVVEADYEVPFQGHTALGPAHALADPSGDQLTIYSNDMKSCGQERRRPVSRPAARPGPGRLDGRAAGYGARRPTMPGSRRRTGAKLGRPVRVQWMRQEETGWDTKGPAYAVRMRGGLDATGAVVALDFERARPTTIISATTSSTPC